ncbi:MAG TPA: sugar phosphate isomerase/epimerase family protein [Xanthobacteraceae bacterium]|jgi:sugar phosphate isomerase/epimerase|nr:sugar phosphate isomerase/epimerase family protein [Xanthobacteraceae bacterium]
MPLNLSLNLATVRMQWKLPQAVEAAARHGFAGVAPWREMVQETGIAQTARICLDSGLRVTGYCRGGLFGADGRENLKAAIDDNKRMIDEAAAIAAECIVVIGGGLPPGSRDLPAARAMFVEGLAAVLPHARDCGVMLALEPMHPMYAADRGCITTLREMLDIADTLGNDGLGIAVDTYHVWWDPELRVQIDRAGKRIVAHHICDWLVPTKHMLTDRGMMGDGVIDFPAIRRMVEAAGYSGIQEVEIFSDYWWGRPGDEVLATAVERFKTVCT